MVDYTRKIIDEFPKVIKVQDKAKTKCLPKQQAIIFHHTVVQLLFLSARAHCVIQTPIAFLTTCVQDPGEDDWGKLKRVLKYLKETITLGIRLEADDAPIVKWCVDASHAVHDDCKSHTGASMMLGEGLAITLSQKTKNKWKKFY